MAKKPKEPKNPQATLNYWLLKHIEEGGFADKKRFYLRDLQSFATEVRLPHKVSQALESSLMNRTFRSEARNIFKDSGLILLDVVDPKNKSKKVILVVHPEVMTEDENLVMSNRRIIMATHDIKRVRRDKIRIFKAQHPDSDQVPDTSDYDEIIAQLTKLIA